METSDRDPMIAEDRFPSTVPIGRFHAGHMRNLEDTPIEDTGQPGHVTLISMGDTLGATYEWTEPVGPNYHRVLQENPFPAMVVRPQ